MQQENKTTERAALDNAIVQCLRLFARHGRQVRQERTAQIKTRDESKEKGNVEITSETN
jgi:hypothetical protein